ncbi:MAG: acyltransferase family protein [Paludibacteraceae bacterium]|nr:acyltransferase family protein [Paludibacteraceae bacterium]
MAARLRYVDQLKGLAIIFVVLGHIIQNYGLNSTTNSTFYYHFILAFHMPLFGILSGMFFSTNKSIIEILCQKFYRLIVPLTFWCMLRFGFIPLLCDSIVSYQGGDQVHFFSIFRNVCYGIWNWGFWFLRALFFCFVYTSLFCWLFRRYNILGPILSIFLLYFLFWLVLPNVDESLNGFLFLCPFFCFGWIYRQYENKIDRYKISLFISSVIVFFLLLPQWRGFLDTFYWMNTSLLETIGYADVVGLAIVERTIVRFLLGISGSLVFIMCFSWLEKMEKNNGLVFYVLDNLGKCSIGIYICHSILLDYLPHYSIPNIALMSEIGCILLTILYVSVSFYSYKWTENIPVLSKLMWGTK